MVDSQMIEMCNIQSENEQLLAHLIELETEYSSKSLLLKEGSDKLESVSSRVKSLESKVADSVHEKQDVITKLQTKIGQKQDTIDSQLVALCNIQSENEQLQAHLIELETECTSKSLLIKEGYDKIDSVSSTVKSLKAEIEAMKSSHQEILEENNTLQRELTEQMYWFMTRLEDEDLNHENEMANIQLSAKEKYTLLRKRTEEALENNQNLKDQVIKLKEAVEEKSVLLDEAHCTAHEKEAQWTKALNHLETVVESFKAEKKDMDAALADVKSQYHAKEEIVETLTQEIQNSHCISEMAKQRIEFLEDDSKANAELMQSIREELVKTYKELNLPRTDGDPVNNNNSIMENLVILLRNLRETIKDFQSNAIAGFELANSREKAVSRLERTLNSKERDIESLHEQVHKFKTIVSDLKTEQSDLKDRNIDLEKKVNTLELEIEDLEEDYCESEEILARIRDQKSFLEAEIKYHKDELDLVKQKMCEAETQMKEYEVKLLIYKDAVDDAEERAKEKNEKSSNQVDFISRLEAQLEDVSSEVETLVLQNESLEKEIDSMLSKLQQSEIDAKEAISRITELEATIQHQSSMVEMYESENKTLFDNNQRLLSELEATEESLHQSTLDFKETTAKLQIETSKSQSKSERIKELENTLSETESEVKSLSNSLAMQKKEFQDNNDALTDECEHTKARLHSVERLIQVHDKECARLLNDIESKEEEITTLHQTISDLEATKIDLTSKVEVQKEEILSLNDAFQNNEVLLTNARETLTTKGKEIDSLQSQLDLVTEKVQKSEASIVQVEGKLNEANELLSAKELELQTVKDELTCCTEALSKNEDTIQNLKRNLSEKTECEINDIVNKIQSPCVSSSGSLESQLNHSPSASSLVNKHSELLNDLVKMKSIIQDVITPMKDSSAHFTDKENHETMSSLQEELEEKNKVLSLMDGQIDDLLRDISDAEKALIEKDASITMLEKENNDLLININNLQINIKKVERALSLELRRRSKIENEFKLLKKENKTLANECETKAAALGQANHALEKKSRDVDDRENVARQLAHQLQSTKHKIIALKSHLKREGLLQNSPPNSRRYQYPRHTASQEYEGSNVSPDFFDD